LVQARFASQDHPLVRTAAANYVNQQIVLRQQQPNTVRSAQNLADEILFKKLLQKEMRVLIYEHRPLLPWVVWLAICGMLFTFEYYCYLNLVHNETRPENYLFFLAAAMFLPIKMITHYHKFMRSVVTKITYDAKSRSFEMRKHRVLFPLGRTVQVPASDLMFTGDRRLHRMYVNYINIRNLETYFIAKEKAWVNIRLFSYLIEQNVKSRVHQKKEVKTDY
jgi:hypothetical protein